MNTVQHEAKVQRITAQVMDALHMDASWYDRGKAALGGNTTYATKIAAFAKVEREQVIKDLLIQMQLYPEIEAIKEKVVATHLSGETENIPAVEAFNLLMDALPGTHTPIPIPVKPKE
jgi:hypothetical protein